MVEGFNHKDIYTIWTCRCKPPSKQLLKPVCFLFLDPILYVTDEISNLNLNLGFKMVWLKNQFSFKHILAKSISKVYKILMTFTYYFIMFYFFNLNSDIIMKWIKISIFLIWKVIDFTEINIVAGTKKYQRLALFS